MFDEYVKASHLLQKPNGVWALFALASKILPDTSEPIGDEAAHLVKRTIRRVHNNVEEVLHGGLQNRQGADIGWVERLRCSGSLVFFAGSVVIHL
jgi:hypothetical protein